MATIFGSFFAKSVTARPKRSEQVGRGDGIGGAVLDLVGAEAVEFPRIVERRLIAAAFFGDDVEHDGLVQRLQVLEGADEQRQVVAVDGAEVTHAEFLEQDVLEKQVLRAFLDPVGERAHGFAGDFLDEIRGLAADGGVGVVGLERVEITGDGADVLVDGPLVVVEHDDEFLGRFGDVVERFERRSAGEGGVSGDGDDVVVPAGQIAGGGHAERGGKRGAGVARAVGSRARTRCGGGIR